MDYNIPCVSFFKPVVLSLWVMASFRIQWHFHMDCPRPLENTDIYIMNHNNSKITVVKQREK